LALALPALASSATSWKKSKTSRVFLRPSAAVGAAFGVAQQVDHRLDVVAAQHGAQQLGGLDLGDQAAGEFALGNLGQELGLHLGGVVNAGGNAVGQQLHQEGLFTGRGFCSSSTRAWVCCFDRGSGGMPRAARSATC
jgi:hypothetical protein